MEKYPDFTEGLPRTNRYPLTPEHEMFVKDIAALINERQRIAQKARERYASMSIYISSDSHLEMLNLPKDGFYPDTPISDLLDGITVTAPDRITVCDKFGGVTELSLTELHMPVREFAKETRRTARALAAGVAASHATPWARDHETHKEELRQLVAELNAALRKEDPTPDELARRREAESIEEAIKEYKNRA